MNPIASVVLLAAIVLVLGYVPNRLTWEPREFGPGKNRFDVGVAPNQPLSRSDFAALYLVRDTNALRLHDPDNESWDSVIGVFKDRPQDVMIAHVDWRHWFEGLWAGTAIAESCRLILHGPGSWSPSERAVARELVAARVSDGWAGFPGELGPRIAAGDSVVRRTLWTGYAANIGVPILLAGFGYSLLWVPRAPGWIRARRRRAALSRGVCPKCGYAIAGLPAPRCPECGEGLGITGSIASDGSA